MSEEIIEDMLEEVAPQVAGDYPEIAQRYKAGEELTEDDLKIAEKDLQKLTDDMCKELDALLEKKEKELMEV